MKWHIFVLKFGYIMLIVAVVVLVVTRPRPKPDERLLKYEHIIAEQTDIIDSLKVELSDNFDKLDSIRNQVFQSAKQFEKTIASQRQQLQENETIHSLPTPELDSIVRSLYGEGAI